MMSAKAPYDILGIGSPIVDSVIPISNDYLVHVPGAKGGMLAVEHAVFENIIQGTDKEPLVVAGGSSANTIRSLARLGHHCAFTGKMGQDRAGKIFVESLTELKVVPFLRQSRTATAQTVCLVTPEGERTMRSFLGASCEMGGDDLDETLFTDVKLVHLEGYTLLNRELTSTAMKMAKKAGALVSFDLGSFEVVKNYRTQILSLLEEYVDILFGNREEMFALTQRSPDESCSRLKKLCNTVVVLLGVEGCIVGQESQQIPCPAYPAEALDSTGAGDYFASGFLHGYLGKKSLQQCAHYGALLGAAVVQVQGVRLSDESWQRIFQLIK